MHRRRCRAVALGVALVLLAGCASAHPLGEEDRDLRSSWDEGNIPPSAFLVTRDALSQRSGSLLEAMSQEVSSMEVVWTRRFRCPLIALRGPVTGSPASNPLVYVDGTRLSSGTCALDNLMSGSVEHVELYPTGHTERSGYATYPHGLILVFMRAG